ncbi:hypothetical protein VPNG_10032 [Cytospora leucostoma]|uniref:Uncharacterized protein n=1 Tax=Cytospora leucostoma TaxID=1230097 RepID=A0A423VHA9_9PEZI|nr:hypothetical protein VPNG_10032 [Cytospora leucostoma]
MPFSTAGPVSRHRRALGRILGMVMDDTIEIPGDPSREFLASKEHCKNEALHARQTTNGIYLYQTVDWFLEFAPTPNDNDHYKQEFRKWALVRDECGIKSERLTPNNVEKIYKAFQGMRVLYQKHHHQKYPAAEEGPIPDENRFFIKLVDETGIRFDEGYSRFQLHYGLRRDDNFGERMASRVAQWRNHLKEPNQRKLLVDFPKMAPDVLPVKHQDNNFKQMAEKYALRFNKVSCKTIVAVTDDDDVLQYVDVSNDSPETAMLKNIGLQLNNIKADMDKQAGRITAIAAKMDGMAKDMSKHFNTIKQDIDAMSGVLDSVKSKEDRAEESLSRLAELMKNTKTMVSHMFRDRR